METNGAQHLRCENENSLDEMAMELVTEEDKATPERPLLGLSTEAKFKSDDKNDQKDATETNCVKEMSKDDVSKAFSLCHLHYFLYVVLKYSSSCLQACCI